MKVECDLSLVTLGALVEKVTTKEVTVMSKGVIIWDGEDDEQVEIVRNKKMEVILNKEIDNRLVFLEGDEMLCVVWVMHLANVDEI